MYTLICIIIVLVLLSIIFFKQFWATYNELKIGHLFQTAKYHIVYNMLGAKALVEDRLYKGWNETDLPLRSGQVAVVTGGSRGIGFEVVKKLLQCDMHVVVGCRNIEAGQKALQQLNDLKLKIENVECYELDLASMTSVQKFASKVLAKHPFLHLLVNNAGIMFVPYKLTEDGFESHFAVNYLGHFLLTHLLLPHLKKSGMENCYSRIVNVSSCAYAAGAINFKDVTMKDFYIPSASYAQSKLAQLMFTKTLDARLRDEGSCVQVHAVHPGIVNTELFDGTYIKNLAPWLPGLIFKSPDQGSVPIVHAAVSTKLEGQGGSYIENCLEVRCSLKVLNNDKQKKLWELSCDMLKIKNFGN